MIAISTLSDALRTYYLPAVVEQMNYATNAFYAAIEHNNEEVDGDTIKMAMKYGRQGGVGARDEQGNLPNPGNRNILQVQYGTKNIFGRLMITDKMIEIGKTNKAAFVNVLEMTLEDTLTDAKDQFGRMLYMDGNGKLATCTAQGPVNTLTLDSVQYLCEGHIIDILDSVGTVKTSARTITVVDQANKQITIDGAAVTTLATDIIGITGNYGYELTGLDAIFKSTGVIYGKDRASYKFLAPNFSDNANAELDEIKLQAGIDTAEIRAGGTIDFLIGSYGIARAYQYLMNALRSNIEIMDLKGGYKTMSYNGLPFVRDKYSPVGVLWMLQKNDFKLHEIGDWNWMDKDGAILCRVSGKAAYEASLVKYGDLGCRRPSGQTKMYNIKEH